MGATSRRVFLGHGFSAAALIGCKGPAAYTDGTLTDPTGTPLCDDPFAGGTFIDALVFEDEPDDTAFGVKTSQGWDARLRTDLAALEGTDLVTPNDLFYIRTELPDLLTTTEAAWRVAVRGLVDTELELTMAEIRAGAVDQGDVLIECAGNTDSGNFGLMSSARWAGTPLLDLLDQAGLHDDATRVVVCGNDDHSIPSVNGHSTPGAEWAFTLDDLARYGAFLATEMNGVPLPLDHGFPVRLVVPGWYGCACIKWVTEVRVTTEDEPATGQMLEFASRTHQPGDPNLARDHIPAVIDLASMPIRVEKWLLDGAIAYRVVGISWGGEATTDALRIRFGQDEEPVTACAEGHARTWRLWAHRWQPTEAKRYRIRMAVDDPQVRTRRLDEGWYDRAVSIDEV